MGRISMIFALITTAVAFVLLVVGFLGSNPHAGSLNNVYLFKIKANGTSSLTSIASDAMNGDLSSLANEIENYADGKINNNKRADSSSDNKDLQFTIGAYGYCLDDKCYQGPTPFYFDFENAIKSAVNVELPSELSDYQNQIKSGGKAIWILTVIAIAALALSAVTGCFSLITSCCSKVSFVARFPAIMTVLLSVLGLISAIGSAGAATGLYAIIKNRFNDYSGDLNLESSLGSAGLAVYWVGAIFALISCLIWSAAARSTRRQIMYAAPAPAPYQGAHYP